MYPAPASVSEASLRSHLQYVHDEQHTVTGGLAVSLFDISADVGEFSSQTASLRLEKERPLEVAGHLEHEWRISPALTSRLGFRTTYFRSDGGTLLAFDPRLSGDLRVSDGFTLFSSFAAVTQFLHAYNQGGLFLFFPVNVWYPSTERIRPSRSLQFALGGEISLPGRDSRLTGRLYFRQADDIHEFLVLPPTAANHDFRDALITGRGTSEGLSLSWRSIGERWDGLITYDLSWTRHQFAGLNSGEPYAPRMDRRHEVTVGCAFVPSAGWQIRGSWVYTSNHSPTYSPNATLSEGAERSGGVLTNPSYDAGFVAINGSRIPGFQRLDISVTHEISGLGVPLIASLRFHNAYAVLDPFSWGLRSDPDQRFRWWVEVDPPGLFPLFPSLNLSVAF
jgi:hypothetical protein